MSKYWVVKVSFPFDIATYEAMTAAVEKVVGRKLSGAGTGFGARDVDWTYKSKAAAERAVKKISAKYPDMDLDLSEYDDEDWTHKRLPRR